MVAVRAGLGGSLSVAFNALNPVPAIGCRGAPLRSRLVGSLDAISVIKGCLALSL